MFTEEHLVCESRSNVNSLSLLRPWQSGRWSARCGHYYGRKGEDLSDCVLKLHCTDDAKGLFMPLFYVFCLHHHCTSTMYFYSSKDVRGQSCSALAAFL